MDLVRKLILERMQELDLNMAEISKRLGKNETYLQQFLKRGSPRELHERDRIRLAEILHVTEDRLRGPSTALPVREYTRSNTARVVQSPQTHVPSPREGQTNNKLTPASQLVGEADLPVFATAQGGHGALIVTDQAVEWVVRPAPLVSVRDGYGMIVSGDSMSPKFEPGDTLLVHPHRPARAGDICIFRNHAEDGTTYVAVKEYRGETDSAWKVRQYNPARDFILKKSEWQVRHKVIGTYFA